MCHLRFTLSALYLWFKLCVLCFCPSHHASCHYPCQDGTISRNEPFFFKLPCAWCVVMMTDQWTRSYNCPGKQNDADRCEVLSCPVQRERKEHRSMSNGRYKLVRTSSKVCNQELLAHQLPSQNPSQEYYHWSRCLHNVSASLTITLVSSSSWIDRVHQSGIWSDVKRIPRTLTSS